MEVHWKIFCCDTSLNNNVPDITLFQEPVKCVKVSYQYTNLQIRMQNLHNSIQVEMWLR